MSRRDFPIALLFSLGLLTASWAGAQPVVVRERPPRLVPIEVTSPPDVAAPARARWSMGAAKPQGTTTIVVDCEKGERISKALKREARELIVEIHGMCIENVLVDRDKVTLRGRDPLTDGIQGDPAGAENAVLQIIRANGVRIEGLTIRAGKLDGIQVSYGFPAIANCRIVDNPRIGLLLVTSSISRATDLILSENGQFAAQVQGACALNCNGCEIRDNHGGVVVLGGGTIYCTGCNFSNNLNSPVAVQESSAWLFESSFANPASLRGVINSFLQVSGGSIEVSADAWGRFPPAVIVQDNSEGALSDLPVQGGLQVLWDSHLELFGVRHSYAGADSRGYILADTGSYLIAQDAVRSDGTVVPTSLSRNLWAYGFSDAELRDGTTVQGNVTCVNAGDAFAENPANIFGAVSGCEHLVTPAP